MTWNGEKRRVDDNAENTVQVRLTLLERASGEAERRHAENKESLVAVHKRITELGKDFEATLSKGLDALMDKLDQKNIERQVMRTDITNLQSDIRWIKAWVASAWITISAGIGLLIHRKI